MNKNIIIIFIILLTGCNVTPEQPPIIDQDLPWWYTPTRKALKPIIIQLPDKIIKPTATTSLSVIISNPCVTESGGAVVISRDGTSCNP